MLMFWRCKYISTGIYRAMHFSAKRGVAIACRPSDIIALSRIQQLRIAVLVLTVIR